MHTDKYIWERGSGGIACTMGKAKLSQQQKNYTNSKSIIIGMCKSESKSQATFFHPISVCISISFIFPCPLAPKRIKSE